MGKPARRWHSAAILVSLSLLLSLLATATWEQPPLPLRPVVWSADSRWLTAPVPSYRLYARHQLTLAGHPVGGWLRLSADSDYILYVNGQIVAQELSLPRNTAGLGTRRSEAHQGISDVLGYRGLIPDWLQIAHPEDWRLATYVDLAQHLHPGLNTIALEIQSSRQTPRCVIEGEIYPTAAGPALSLGTGQVPWRIAARRQHRQQLFWFEPGFADSDWPESWGTHPVTETLYSRVAPSLFQRHLQGQWITGQTTAPGELWLRSGWELPQRYGRALVRLAGDDQYGVMINGRLLHQSSDGDGSQLHLYDVTGLVHPGTNTIAVRLTHFWNRDWSRQQSRSLDAGGSLRFYLDGWAEQQGQAVAPVATDASWQSLTELPPDWFLGAGTGSSAVPIAPPAATSFQRRYQGDGALRDYPTLLGHWLGWFCISLAAVLGTGWGLAKWLAWEAPWQSGAALAWPTLLFLSATLLLKHRYAEAAVGIWFARPGGDGWLLTIAAAIFAATLASVLPRQRWLLPGVWAGLGAAVPGLWLGAALAALESQGQIGKQLFQAVAHTARAQQHRIYRLLLAIAAVAAASLRLYDLGAENPEPDENVSWDAVRGILRTGAPVETSGIWYTRGPVYHYLLALWLRLGGDSLVSARLFSVAVGLGTLAVVYYFTRYLTSNRWLALAVTGLLAIDPWELWYSRNIRFYQLSQLFAIAATWAFIAGFVQGRNRWCQGLFFCFLTGTLLSQEVTLLLLPGFFILFLFYYRSFTLRADWPILLGSGLTLAIFAFNIYFVKIKSLTPLVGLSSHTTAFIKLQFNNMAIFVTNFFVGANRMYVVYSALLAIGGWYAVGRRDRKMTALAVVLVANIAAVTVMVFLKAPRYVYPVYPIFIILAVWGGFCLVQGTGQWLQHQLNSRLRWQPILAVGLGLLLVTNIEPVRIVQSYGDSIRPRHQDISQYIQTHRQPGDIVISNIPAGHAIHLGGADYYLIHRMSFFDAVYKRDGRVIDRWEGGVLLTNYDQLSEILSRADRVWLHRFDRQLPKDPELARFFTSLESLGHTVVETYGASLQLWTREEGYLQHMPDKGGSFGAY